MEKTFELLLAAKLNDQLSSVGVRAWRHLNVVEKSTYAAAPVNKFRHRMVANASMQYGLGQLGSVFRNNCVTHQQYLSHLSGTILALSKTGRIAKT